MIGRIACSTDDGMVLLLHAIIDDRMIPLATYATAETQCFSVGHKTRKLSLPVDGSRPPLLSHCSLGLYKSARKMAMLVAKSRPSVPCGANFLG